MSRDQPFDPCVHRAGRGAPPQLTPSRLHAGTAAPPHPATGTASAPAVGTTTPRPVRPHHRMTSPRECRKGSPLLRVLLAEDLHRHRKAGQDVDPAERVSGTVREPGYGRRAANGRLVWSAVRRGALGRWAADLELPSSMFLQMSSR